MAPGPEDENQDEGGEGQSQCRRAIGADQRKQHFGKAGPGLGKDHAQRDEENGNENGLWPHGEGFQRQARVR
jgi:hypothetical protein